MPTNTAKQCRNGDRCVPETFAQALDCLAHHSVDDQGNPLSVGRIAERVGKSENYLRKACSQYDDAHPFRGDLIIPLTLATKNFVVMQFLARRVGGAFFVLPTIVSDTHIEVMQQTATVVGEFGDVLTHIQQTLSDGVVTQQEADRFDKETSEVIGALAHLKEIVHTKVAA